MIQAVVGIIYVTNHPPDPELIGCSDDTAAAEVVENPDCDRIPLPEPETFGRDRITAFQLPEMRCVLRGFTDFSAVPEGDVAVIDHTEIQHDLFPPSIERGSGLSDAAGNSIKLGEFFI